MRIRLFMVAALSGLMALAHAFEPGHDRVCTPSADGLTFECRDKSTGVIEKTLAKPAESVMTAAKDVTAPAAPKAPTATTSTPGPSPAARKLPNYLMQNPSAAEPERDIEPASAIAGQPTDIEPRTGDGQAAVADASPAQAPPIKPAEASHAQGVGEVAVSGAQQPATEPAPTPHSSAATPASAQEIPHLMPEAEPPTPSATASRAETTGLPGASAFLALPASHYTLVLASVRDPSALDGLTLALGAQPGQLYLLKLGMPDGDWYSLCWSDFADLDVARAARASLPADAPISSGWPRRIGLLQKELAR